MFTLTISVKPDEANVAVIAQVAQLLAKLEAQSPAMDPAEPVARPALVVDAVVPVKAPRAKRVYTEAEKQAIRERLAAGRAKAALARGEAVESTQKLRVIEIKPEANHKSGSKAKHGVIEMAVGDDKVSQAVDQAKKSMAAKVARIQGIVHPAPKPSAKKPMPSKGRKVEAQRRLSSSCIQFLKHERSLMPDSFRFVQIWNSIRLLE